MKQIDTVSDDLRSTAWCLCHCSHAHTCLRANAHTCLRAAACFTDMPTTRSVRARIKYICRVGGWETKTECTRTAHLSRPRQAAPTYALCGHPAIKTGYSATQAATCECITQRPRASTREIHQRPSTAAPPPHEQKSVARALCRRASLFDHYQLREQTLTTNDMISSIDSNNFIEEWL